MTDPVPSKERTEAIAIANRLLDEPLADPDDDQRVLARQFLREIERATYRELTPTPEPRVGDAQIARYIHALNEPAKAFQYCHPDTIRELVALLEELGKYRAAQPPRDGQ